MRELALFDLAIDSKLRGCDLVRLTIGHLVVNGAARHRATVIQRKTGQPVQFELTDQTRESVLAWLELRGGTLDDHIFRADPESGSTSAPVNMPASLVNGSRRLVLVG